MVVPRANGKYIAPQTIVRSHKRNVSPVKNGLIIGASLAMGWREWLKRVAGNAVVIGVWIDVRWGWEGGKGKGGETVMCQEREGWRRKWLFEVIDEEDDIIVQSRVWEHCEIWTTPRLIIWSKKFSFPAKRDVITYRSGWKRFILVSKSYPWRAICSRDRFTKCIKLLVTPSSLLDFQLTSFSLDTT